MLEEALRQTKEYQRLREALTGGRSDVYKRQGQAGALAAQDVFHRGLVAAESLVALFEQVQESFAQIYLPP